MNSNEAVIERFCKEYELRLGAETLTFYKKVLHDYFTFCQKEYQEVKGKDIRTWVGHLDQNRQKPTTIRKKMAALRLFFRYLLEEALITKDPTTHVLLPQLEDKLPYYLTREHLIKLREITNHDKRERAIIETLFSTGVRVSELVSIQMSDINWDERQILIRNGKGKKDRLVMFTIDCKERLLDYLAEREDDLPHLFLNKRGNPASVRMVQHLFDEYTKKMGMKMTPHTMRHTFAAHLAQKGMPLEGIQEFLGHDKLHHIKVYARLYEDARKQIYDHYL